jgi:hypothetical protein
MEKPKFLLKDNKNYAMENFRITKKRHKEWKKVIGWMYDFPWRPEQGKIMLNFQKQDWENFVIQAVFGGGKTTMLIAMIFDLILHERCKIDEVMICAFNVAIKNEIKKKVKPLGKVVPRTFDSIVYEICKDMSYADLKHPNFLEKRRFLYQNILRIPEDEKIKYIFIDEAQDLEKNVNTILSKRYPNAKKIIVGDIFQSIQKEPRESLLWNLVSNQENENVYKMTETPRVPQQILDEIQNALYSYYPEFQETISQWKSSSNTIAKGVEWSMFKGYKDIFENIINFIEKYGYEDTMILVFSSAITVRGKLGDVSRVRRFLIEKKIPVNNSHKLMKDNCVFVSTVNSSKGLERKNVFCILTFPLELAFASFSSDMLMNLVTVGLSRCKETIQFCIPSYIDRYSPILKYYNQSPKPCLSGKSDANEKKSFLTEEESKKKSTMLSKEHGITEVLRLQMLSFSTKQFLIESTKKYKETNNVPSLLSLRTEEESTLTGLIFETLLLCSWQKRWSFDIKSVSDIGHEIFENYFFQIKKIFLEFSAFVKKYPFQNCSDFHKVQGAILYSKLHLAYRNKIFCNCSQILEQQILNYWIKIKNNIHFENIDASFLKSQHNVSGQFLNGIIDAVVLNEKDFVDIYEIKASRGRDWNESALLQAIMYGLCLYKTKFRIHLVNVLHSSWQHFYVDIKDYQETMSKIITDIQLYNLNCFLSKNRSFHNVEKKCLNIVNLFFLDGRCKNEEIESIYLYEFTSPTKISLHIQLDKFDPKFWIELKKLINSWGIKKIIVGRHLTSNLIPTDLPIEIKFLNNKTKQINWDIYLTQIGWYKELTEFQKEGKKVLDLNWKKILSTSSIQIAELCEKFNFTL